jgi:transcriptional regulator with GAF, ATPase, and Fis domain
MVKSLKGGVGARTGRKRVRRSSFTLTAEPIPSWRGAKTDLERWLLREALGRTDGNMAAAGRLLGITKVAILHAVRRHGLEKLTNPVSNNTSPRRSRRS